MSASTEEHKPLPATAFLYSAIHWTAFAAVYFPMMSRLVFGNSWLFGFPTCAASLSRRSCASSSDKPVPREATSSWVNPPAKIAKDRSPSLPIRSFMDASNESPKSFGWLKVPGSCALPRSAFSKRAWLTRSPHQRTGTYEPGSGHTQRLVDGRGPASRPCLFPLVSVSSRCHSLALRSGSARLAGMATWKEPPLITDEATWRKMRRRQDRHVLPLPPSPALRAQRPRRLLATVLGVCVLSAVVGLLVLTSGPP